MEEVRENPIFDFSLLTTMSLGAFLIPYFCVYFLIGTPLYFLELSLGQFTSQGATAAFKMSRMFKGNQSVFFQSLRGWSHTHTSGVGWAMAINSFFVTIYYNIIIAWCLFYFFASFRRKLQWSDCDNWWNTERCSPAGQIGFSSNFGANWFSFQADLNATIQIFSFVEEEIDWTIVPCQHSHLKNTSSMTRLVLVVSESHRDPVFSHYVLRRSASLDDMGSPHWALALCLLLAWIMVAACIIQGIKSSGKVNEEKIHTDEHIRFPFSGRLFHFFVSVRGDLRLDNSWCYVARSVSDVILGRRSSFSAVTGAATGISFYLKPNWSKIAEFDVSQLSLSRWFSWLMSRSGSPLLLKWHFHSPSPSARSLAMPVSTSSNLIISGSALAEWFALRWTPLICTSRDCMIVTACDCFTSVRNDRFLRVSTMNSR